MIASIACSQPSIVSFFPLIVGYRESIVIELTQAKILGGERVDFSYTFFAQATTLTPLCIALALALLGFYLVFSLC